MYLAVFKEVFVFVKLHLFHAKFNIIFDYEIVMMADILTTATFTKTFKVTFFCRIRSFISLVIHGGSLSSHMIFSRGTKLLKIFGIVLLKISTF